MCKNDHFPNMYIFKKSQGLGQFKIADFFPDFGVAIMMMNTNLNEHHV